MPKMYPVHSVRTADPWRNSPPDRPAPLQARHRMQSSQAQYPPYWRFGQVKYPCLVPQIWTF